MFNPARDINITDGMNSSNPTSYNAHAHAHFLGNLSASAMASSPSLSTTAPVVQSDSRDDVQLAPSFLFGAQQQSRRRSFATSNRATIHSGFGSPGILRNRDTGGMGSGGKNVHWSPVLEKRERSKSPDEKKLLSARYGGGGAGTRSETGSTTAMLWNGPPLRSLNEDVVSPPAEKVIRLDSHGRQHDPHVEKSLRGASSSAKDDSHSEIVELDTNGREETEGNEEDNIYWVTVFGFPNDQRNSILELFARHGDIMAEKTPKQGGNWIHIRYSSPVHARQALAKNATIYKGNMIGVLPCNDKEALEDKSAVSDTPLVAKKSSTSSHSMNGSFSSSILEDSLFNGSASGSKFLLGDCKMVPSLSAYKTANLPNRSCLSSSISRRAGMRPLNSSMLSVDGDQSFDMSNSRRMIAAGTSSGGNKDDSLIGKLWNMFASSNASGGSASNSSFVG